MGVITHKTFKVKQETRHSQRHGLDTETWRHDRLGETQDVHEHGDGGDYDVKGGTQGGLVAET